MLGTLIVVSGPSGAGKTTIVETSIARNGIGVRVITCTTRKPRNGETDEKDYRFFSKKVFREKIRSGEFVEYAKVYGCLYGTLAADITSARENFPIVFLVTDVQGTATVLRRYPEARSIFISIARKELIRRLHARGEFPKNTAPRIAEIDKELAEICHFDKVIRNRAGRLNTAIREFLLCVTEYRVMDELVEQYA